MLVGFTRLSRFLAGIHPDNLAQPSWVLPERPFCHFKCEGVLAAPRANRT